MSGALLLLIMNLIGLGLGPTFVGAGQRFLPRKSSPSLVADRALPARAAVRCSDIAVPDPGSWCCETKNLTVGETVLMSSLPRVVACSLASVCLVLAPSNFAQQSASASTPSSHQRGPIVKAPAGALEGQTEGDLRVFKGIPYALPPVGSARWKPPSQRRAGTASNKLPTSAPICFQAP